LCGFYNVDVTVVGAASLGPLNSVLSVGDDESEAKQRRYQAIDSNINNLTLTQEPGSLVEEFALSIHCISQAVLNTRLFIQPDIGRFPHIRMADCPLKIALHGFIGSTEGGTGV
jgi:hypothetical protein